MNEQKTSMMKEKLLALLMGFMALFLTGLSVQAQTATVATDKADYQPGDTVMITGTGWQPGETVKMEIDHSSVSHGSSILYTTANSHGEINNQELLILPIHLGEVFNLVATGLSSMLTANTVFTDANFISIGSGNWNSASTWSQSGTPADMDGIPDVDDVVRILSGHTVYVLSGRTEIAASVILGSSTESGTAVLELQGTGVLAVSGNIALGEGPNRFGSLRFTGAGTLSIGGLFTAPQLGTFSPGAGKIEYKGNGSQTILSTAALGGVPYHNLIVSNSRGSSNVTLTDFSLTGNYTDNANFVSGNYLTTGSDVTFAGTANQNINGSGNKTVFNSIIINNSGAANNNIVEVISSTFSAFAGFLTLKDGIFKFSKPVFITPFIFDPNYPADAGFWNNGGTVFMVNEKELTLNGLLRNSAGTINIGNSSEDYLRYTSGSNIIIEGGNINIAGSLRPSIPGISTTNYNQSGGTLTAGTSGSQSTSTGIFDISATGSSFTMTGGRIVIQRSNMSFSSDYINLATTNTVTGGIVQIGNTSTPSSQTIRINSTVPIFNLLIDATTTTKTAQLITNWLTIKNDFTISGGALSANNLELQVGGNWSNSGTFTPGAGTVSFNGTAIQAIQGFVKTGFNNLTVSNSSGLRINTPTTVGGILNFQAGLITPNTGTLTIESSGSTLNSTSTKYVNGKLGWIIPPDLAKTFPIGKGGNYRPVTFKYNSVSGTSTVSIEQFESSLTGALPENLNLFDARYWDVSQLGITNPDYNITLDPTGFTPIGTARIIKKESGTISSHATTTPNYTNSTAFTSLTGTNSFALGESITITTTAASSAAITYGDASVTLSATVSPVPTSGTVTFFVNEIAAGTGHINGSGVASLVYDPHSLAAVTHTIRAEFNGSEGYDASSSVPSANGLLTINKKELTASITGSVTRIYNGTRDAVLTATNYTLPGLINGDIVNLNNPSGGIYDSKHVGVSKEVNVSGLSLNGTGAANYFLSSTMASANIGQITIKTATVTAQADTKDYDGNSSSAVSPVVTGLIFPDAMGTAPTQTFDNGNAGNNKIMAATGLTINDGNAGGNYIIEYVTNNTGVIKARHISITADAKSKSYGESDPLPFTFQISSGSLVNGENFTGTLSRVSGENVGNYAVQKGSVTISNNYVLDYVPANLMITARPVTIAAVPTSKYCGQVDPVLTCTIISGSLINGDTLSGNLSRNAGESAEQAYTINQGTVALPTNYALTYKSSVLTINTVTADANGSSTPRAILIPITLTATASPQAPGVSVSFYVDNVFKGSSLTSNDGVAAITIAALPSNVYAIKAVAGAGCAEAAVFLPVYDPNGGFVTGGGWINSPAGALRAEPIIIGKANFGFVAKYKKGSTVPEGNTEFQFKAGNMNFNSSAYDDMRLVIAGSKANYKGTGTINGTGDYGFLVSAIDGQATGGGGTDKFRIKIWDKNDGEVIYDNNMGANENDLPLTILGGGSIVIHEVKNAKVASTVPVAGTSAGLDMKIIEPHFDHKIKLGVYPNPFQKHATFAFTLPADEQRVTLDVFDLKGSKISRIYEGKASARQSMRFSFDGSNLAPGMYFLRLTTPGKAESFKMIMTE